MECPVCFSEKPLVKLSCGHSFCKTCVKEWYAKAPTCPMCRKTMLFKGVTRLLTESQQKRIDDMYDDVITGVYDLMCQHVCVIPEFILVEKTFNALRMINVDPDTIETVLYETDDTWSERKTYTRLRRFFYNTERPKHRVHSARRRFYGWKKY